MPVTGDPFWTDDISILFRNDRIFDVLPTKENLSIYEQYNAFTRLVLMYGLLVSLYRQRSEFILLAIFFAVLISPYVKRENEKINCQARAIIKEDIKLVEKIAEPVTETVARNDTSDDINPFRNRLVYGSGDVVDGESSITRVHDEFDVFGRNSQHRMFHTVPNTQVANDQSGYAQWLYGGTAE